MRQTAISVKILLVVFGVVMGVIGIEIYLRMFPQPNRYAYMRDSLAIWQSDAELLLHLKPGLDIEFAGHPEFRFFLRTNAHGLRDDEDIQQRIAIIGDSFTFGLGVNDQEAYPQRLEEMSQVPVLNLGWVGWNSYVYPAGLRRHALDSGARIWLWAFFINDLTESTAAEAFTRSGQSDYLAHRQQVVAAASPMMQIRVFETLAALLDRSLLLPPDAGAHAQTRLGEMYVSPYPWYQSDPANPSITRGWELTETAAQDIADLAQQHEARVLVVFIPAREHTYWNELRGAMQGYSVLQLDQAAERLRHISVSNGFAYLNLLDAFRAAAAQTMLYFPADGHWNAAGHHLAAESLYAELRRLGWL